MVRPDVDIVANFRADELRFGKASKPKLTFESDPSHDHDSHSKVERENLPEEVEEGVTYRDVGVRWTVDQRIVHPTDPAQVAAREENEKRHA
jgi:hypothetical protein